MGNHSLPQPHWAGFLSKAFSLSSTPGDRGRWGRVVTALSLPRSGAEGRRALQLQFWPGLRPALFPPFCLCRAPLPALPPAPPASRRGHQRPPGRELGLGQGWRRAPGAGPGGALTPGPAPLCAGFALGGQSPLLGKVGRCTRPRFCLSICCVARGRCPAALRAGPGVTVLPPGSRSWGGVVGVMRGPGVPYAETGVDALRLPEAEPCRFTNCS